LIGTGSMGKVFQGKWRGLTVAVKEVQHSASEAALQNELALLIRVRHPNLCLFLGVAQPSPHKLLLVSEYMARGNLYSVLHDRSLKLDWRRRLSMAVDAARAMNYLHCSHPPILHAHLTSINLLVDSEFVTKVGDYALDTLRLAAKNNRTFTQPLWSAPELLFKKNPKPTKAADVYAFGIILWEILTRRTPYQGLIKGGVGGGSQAAMLKAIRDISDGLRPTMPDRTPSKMAALITRCWSHDPSARPSFQQIVDELSDMERERSATIESHNTWLKQQVELDDIAIASADRTDVKSLLSEENKKAWMVSSNEIHYESVLGRGSFGEVWLGTFRGKKVAIKKLEASASALLKGSTMLAHGSRSNESLLREFLKELNLMCSLRHPNCVLFMGACLEEGHYCLLMEYLAKGDLYRILHDIATPIDYSLILKILNDIAEGVLYLHMAKPRPILHRDLKSSNILVDEDWTVKVSDFGLTEFKPDPGTGADGMPLSNGATGGQGRSASAAAAQTLQIGTPFWQAPECMERGEFSEASDAYAFGMIVWELFTREVPFAHLNPHQAALAVIADDQRPTIPNFVPPKFAELMLTCWQRDPRKRPSFQQIIERLKILKKEGLPRMELNAQNAKLYRKKTTVFAFKSKDAVIVYKTWGTGEGKKGDWVIVGPGDDVYTCDAAIFQKTYSLVDPQVPHLYRKTGSIYAKQMDRDFLVETLEGMEYGTKGDWIAQNPVDGEQWPIAADTFAMYELAPEQTIPGQPTPTANVHPPASSTHSQQSKSKENGLTQRKKPQ